MILSRNSRVAGTIPILIAVCFLNLPALAQYSGGSGTAEDPYQIATPEDLMLLGETPENYDKHFILTADINLDPNLPGRKVLDRAVISPDTDPAKKYYQGNSFTGVFDGNNQTISHLTITGVSYLGLFGRLGSEAIIFNIGLEAVDVNGTGDNLGGLVGRNYGSITTSYSTGTVSGKHDIGGLVGLHRGSIVTSYSMGTVNGKGGSYITGVVGGLVGSNDNDSSITSSYSTAAISGIGKVRLGGLVGRNSGRIATCFWDMETSGQITSAGGIGKTTAEMQSALTFLIWGTCGNEGIWTIDEGRDYPRLRWQNMTGELIEIGATLSDFLTGAGTKDSPYLIYTSDELNLIGLFPCDWDKHFKLMADIDLSGFLYNAALIAPNNSMLEGGFAGTPFTGIFDGNGHTISQLTITGTDYLGLFGLLDSSAEVRDLGIVDVNIAGTDIVGGLAGYNRGIITASYSTGTVNGSDSVTWWYYGGVGGLVGSNHDGSITSSYSTVMVSRRDGYFGGLVGFNSGSGTIARCCAICTVRVVGLGGIGGGLVGVNLGADTAATVSDCYSIVLGDSYVSGLLVGRNSWPPPPDMGDSYGPVMRGGSSHITNCYASCGGSGIVNAAKLVGWNYSEGEVSNCFWDANACGPANYPGGAGTHKTTAEIQMAGTFLEAGWDFIDETENGPNDIWKIWDGYDYPRLAWEAGPMTPLVFVDVNDPGFFGQMSKYEVTNAQYCDFLNAALVSGDVTVNGTKVEGAGGSNSGQDYAGQLYYNGDGSGYTGYGATNGGAARIRYNGGAFGVDDGFGDHPVTYVSWYGAMAFANYYGYYLPAEDQWQAVADYDGTYIYGCGQTIDPGIANYRVSEHPDGTMPVGSFGAYGYGMSDMAGNVWEWTSSSLGNNRVFRGGSLGSVESDCAVSLRGDGIPRAAYWDIGFRVCR